MSNVSKPEIWVAEKIISLLESGTLPSWRKSWKASDVPRNACTGTPYKGGNFWFLMMLGDTDARYLTLKQAGKAKGRLKPEWQAKWDDRSFRGHTVFFWSYPTEAEKQAGKRPFCKAYYVFNIDMFEGLDESELKSVGSEQKNENERIEACEAIVRSYKQIPKIEHGGDRACYSPAFDVVKMPKMEAFGNSEEYYSTLFHELGHSTGHESRLSRPGVTNPVRFGSHDYSEEELVAEFTAASLCGRAGIENVTLENSAAYIQHWLGKLKGKPEVLAAAIRESNKAVRMILDEKFGKGEE